VSNTDSGLAQHPGPARPQARETKLPESIGGAIAEQLARIEQVIWSTPIAAEVEPWVTPRWDAAGVRIGGEADRG
jgi:hypothetical protein